MEQKLNNSSCQKLNSWEWFCC